MHVDLVRLAGSRGRLVEHTTVDPVTAEVIRDYLETVCFEMATYVSRTATTPILNQSNERNATILDAQGRLAALSVGIPQFMLTSTLPVRFALEFLGVDEFREGDVFAANDPYHGGGHLPDYNVFAPVFADDPAAPNGRRMVLIASIQCHHGDTGGAVPGGYNVTANDVWGEGVRWPVLKVVDQGRERRDVLYALQANNRLPDYLGDLRAQIGAAQLAAKRLGELLDRWGAATVEQSVDYMIDYAARRCAAGPMGCTRPTPTSTTTPSATRTCTCTSRSPSPGIGSRSTSPVPTTVRSCRPGRRSATPAATRSARSPR
jgi:N-methylhydantoinase B